MLREMGRLKEFDYGLFNQVLDHIEVTDVGRLAVIFFTGTRTCDVELSEVPFLPF